MSNDWPRFDIPRDIAAMLDEPVMALKTFTVAELRAMSDRELHALLTGEDGRGGVLPLTMHSAITSELLRRATRAHWTLVPAYWLIVVGTTTTVAGLLFAVFAYLRPSPASPAAPLAPATIASPASSANGSP